MAHDGHANSGTASLLRTSRSISLTQSESHTSDDQTTSPALGAAHLSADDAALIRADSSTSVKSLGPKEAATAAEKKRNKLGYHRTAVACGHCRRRKIRCIPANDDESGRCQNCIRLKKDCQFSPVDLSGQPLSKPPTPALKSEVTNELLLQNSGSSANFGPLSATRTQESDESMLAGSFSLPGSFQGEWVGGVDQSADFNIPQEINYHQSLHHPRPLAYTVPSNAFDNQFNPYMSSHHQQGSSGSFSQSHFGLMPPSGSMDASPESAVMGFAQPGAGIEQVHWTPETTSRSVSINDADVDELGGSNGVYHHPDAYMSMKRRELQKAGLAPQVKDVHPGAGGGHYSHPTMYQSTLQQGMEWSGGIAPGVVGHPVPVSEAAHPQAGWYIGPGSCQTKAQQEEQAQWYQPHATAYQHFRPKPG